MNNQISFEKDKATGEPVAILDGRFTMSDLVNILSQLEKQTGQMPAALTDGTIDVIPIVSHQTGEPRVELQSAAFDKPLQMDHAQAFQLGHMIIEATATAIGDAMLFGFIHTQLGIARNDAAGMLHAFRGYRGQMLSNGDQGEKPDV